MQLRGSWWLHHVRSVALFEETVASIWIMSQLNECRANAESWKCTTNSYSIIVPRSAPLCVNNHLWRPTLLTQSLPPRFLTFILWVFRGLFPCLLYFLATHHGEIHPQTAVRTDPEEVWCKEKKVWRLEGANSNPVQKQFWETYECACWGLRMNRCADCCWLQHAFAQGHMRLRNLTGISHFALLHPAPSGRLFDQKTTLATGQIFGIRLTESELEWWENVLVCFPYSKCCILTWKKQSFSTQ